MFLKETKEVGFVDGCCRMAARMAGQASVVRIVVAFVLPVVLPTNEVPGPWAAPESSIDAIRSRRKLV